MSEPKARPTVRMSPEEIWAFVTDAHTGILVTLRRDGVPVALPLWFVALDERIYVQTRGKKLERIRRDPRASFLVETGERWAELKAVHFTGQAEIIEPDEELGERFAAGMASKYSAFRTAAAAMPTETRQHYQRSAGGLVRFTPEGRIVNWDNAKLGLA